MDKIILSNNFQPILLQEFFEHQANKTPNKIALQYHDEKLSYQQLDILANQLAHYITELNLPAESLIPCTFNRPVLYVIAILAILKSGHCYVPLSLNTPVERLNLMLDQLDCQYLLTDTAGHLIIGVSNKSILMLDEVLSNLKQYSPEKPDLRRDSQSLAYMIFTSGSTGTPKGVLMEHTGPINIIKHMTDMSSLNENEYFIQNVNFSFDPHVWTLFWPLAIGATVILQNESEQHDASYLIKLINQYQIRVLHAGVSLTKAILKLPDIATCQSLRQIIGGGEAWTAYTVNELFEKLPACELVNVYGPTETCIHVTFWRSHLAKEIRELIPIGKVVANYQIYILDENLNQVTAGEKGQIAIGGIGLARGYYKDKAKTDLKFISDHISGIKGMRLYLSGDLGRINEDNDIEFFGRIDEQVQIRGHRVELGEIESVINKFPGISNCVMLANGNDNPELIAFVATKERVLDNKVLFQAINQFLQQKLPNYMLPKKLLLIHDWPLTNHGKIDKKKLLELIPQAPAPSSSLDENSVKQQVARIWCEVLGLTDIQDNDDFFQVGGDSLNALDIIAKINHQLNADFSISTLFDYPILENLIAFILTNQTVKPELTEDSMVRDNHVFELSLNQKRLIRLAGTNSGLNNGIIPLAISGQLNIEILKQAGILLASHHEVLRANVNLQSIDQMRIANTINENFFKVVDLLSNQQKTATFETAFALIAEYLEAPIDITKEPLFQIIVISYTKNDALILIYLNHVIADSYTGKFVVENLIAYYQSLLAGLKPVPSEINQFHNYVLAEKNFYRSERLNEQLDFWLALVLKQQRALDFGSHNDNDLSAGFTSLLVPNETASRLRRLAIENKQTLFTVLITIFAKSLFDLGKQNEFIVAFTYSIRDKHEFQNMLGPLSNKLLLPLNFEAIKNISQLLKQVNHNLMNIYKNSEIQVDALREAVMEQEGEDFVELFNIIFDYEKEAQKNWQMDANTIASTAAMFESSQVKRHLSVRVMDNNETLVFNIRYRKAIFSIEKIDYFKEILLNNAKLLISEVIESESEAIC